MLDKILPQKIYYFLELIRFFKPIGFMLLMWPCWFALTLLTINQFDLLKWYFLFFIGSFLMRSAGCIINDIVDIEIDSKVQRTKNRPLASEKISILEAIFFLLLLLITSLLILFQFNINAIIFGIASLPFVILYPFMKRYTYWPQITLGIIFNWGIFIVSINFFNSLNFDFIILYLGCFFWTLAYDTIYAYQDRSDDVDNKIKSTAVLFGEKGLIFIKSFYLIFFLCIAYLIWKTNSNFYSLIVIIMYIILINKFLNKWNPMSKSSSNYYFKFNNIIGLSCFLFLLIF